MAQVDRLGALQVRVAGHRPVPMGLREVQQPGHQRGDQLPRTSRPRPDVESQVRGHLVVSRSPGVELAADGPRDLGQPALDRHVDVLVLVEDRE